MSDEQLSKWVDDFMNDNKRNPAQGQAIKLMQDQKIRIAELEAELAEVREVVQKLPKTADGVIVVDVVSAWFIDDNKVVEGAVGLEEQAAYPIPELGCLAEPNDGCASAYSTREAAEAALASREGGSDG